MEARFLTVDEVAERFGVNPTTVYRLVKGRVLPAIKIGAQWRFSQQALDSWVQGQLSVRPEAARGRNARRRGKR